MCLVTSLLHKRIYPSTVAYLNEVNSDEISAHVRNVQLDLIVSAFQQKWITPDEQVVVSDSYTDIGSNTFVSELDLLYTMTEEDPTLVLNPAMTPRYVNNSDLQSYTRLVDMQKLLRVRYGDNVMDAYSTRILHAYFDMAILERQFERNSLEPFSSTFLNGWWLIYAYQNTMNLVASKLLAVDNISDIVNYGGAR